MNNLFHLQGHRGARGLRPENTLPSFEAALDAGVSSVETDLHLTSDAVPVLCHDPVLPPGRAAVAALPLAELRRYVVPALPHQDPGVTPLARRFADERGLDPHGVPTLAELFAFAAAYAGAAGERAGKTDAQRTRAAGLRFDLELKRVPFYPEAIGDGFDGERPGRLERRVLEEVRAAGVVGRTHVRSFDHRCVRLLVEEEPGLTGAVLVTGTAPVDPAAVAGAARATWYCPGFDYLDARLVREAQAGGLCVVPWTVNEPAHWERLLGWGVDGMTTDYPDRLAEFLRRRGVAF